MPITASEVTRLSWGRSLPTGSLPDHLHDIACYGVGYGDGQAVLHDLPCPALFPQDAGAAALTVLRVVEKLVKPRHFSVDLDVPVTGDVGPALARCKMRMGVFAERRPVPPFGRIGADEHGVCRHVAEVTRLIGIAGRFVKIVEDVRYDDPVGAGKREKSKDKKEVHGPPLSRDHRGEHFERLELVTEEVASDGAGERADLEDGVAGHRRGRPAFDRGSADGLQLLRDVVADDERVAGRAGLTDESRDTRVETQGTAHVRAAFRADR